MYSLNAIKRFDQIKVGNLLKIKTTWQGDIVGIVVKTWLYDPAREIKEEDAYWLSTMEPIYEYGDYCESVSHIEYDDFEESIVYANIDLIGKEGKIVNYEFLLSELYDENISLIG